MSALSELHVHCPPYWTVHGKCCDEDAPDHVAGPVAPPRVERRDPAASPAASARCATRDEPRSLLVMLRYSSGHRRPRRRLRPAAMASNVRSFLQSCTTISSSLTRRRQPEVAGLVGENLLRLDLFASEFVGRARAGCVRWPASKDDVDGSMRGAVGDFGHGGAPIRRCRGSQYAASLGAPC